MFLYLFFACSSTNERGNLSVASKKAGAFLDITIQPHDATISINGLPWRGEILSKGIYQLTIEKKGFYTENRTLSIDELALLKLDITLRSNDVPLHFYYPTEESFLIRYGDSIQEFQGSATLQVPVGFVEIETASGIAVYSGTIRREQHIHRCPKEPHQKSNCISEIDLASSPLDIAFCQNNLWISTFSENRALYQYDFTNGALLHHMDLDTSTWIRCDKQNLMLLSEKGELFAYEVQSKKKSLLHTFSYSWLNGFLPLNNSVTAFNWYHDKVVQWNGQKETFIFVSKPKGLYKNKEELYILGSEPGTIYDSKGKVIWRNTRTQLVKGSIYSSTDEFWMLDAKNNEIIVVSLTKGESKTVIPSSEGEKKDLLVTDKLVIVAEHFPQTGFSLGKGKIKIYQRESKKLLDEFSSVGAPSKLLISDATLVITDISSKKIQLFDLSPLLKD